MTQRVVSVSAGKSWLMIGVVENHHQLRWTEPPLAGLIPEVEAMLRAMPGFVGVVQRQHLILKIEFAETAQIAAAKAAKGNEIIRLLGG